MADPRETSASNRPHAAVGRTARQPQRHDVRSRDDRRDESAAPVAIYGAQVTLLASANLALWIDVHRWLSVWRVVLPATAAVIMLGFVIGLVRPWATQYI